MNLRHDILSTDPAEPKAMAVGLAALAHPARIEILRHLARRHSCCCGDVVDRLDLAQSTVSQHLKVLVEAGLVKYATDRRRSRYELDRGALAALGASVETLVRSCCSAVQHEGGDG